MIYARNQIAVQICHQQPKYRHQSKSNDDLELIIRSGCDCAENCLLKLCEGPHNYTRGIIIIGKCRSEVTCLSRNELLLYIKAKLLALRSQSRTRTFFDYSITHGNCVFQMCSAAFILCYGITLYQLKEAKKALKLDLHNNRDKFTDRSRVRPEVLSAIESHLVQTDVDRRERNQIVGLCHMSGTDPAMMMHAWMKYHFDLIGDQIPNSHGEIHLEPQDKHEIFLEYASDYPDNHLCYTKFLSVWEQCFDHVKIREYKQVTGKCMTCFKLTELRRRRKDQEGRRLATLLHGFHKSMYMGEKAAYYSRAHQADQEPDNFISLISDGMAQNHTRLPWLANMKDFSDCLPQHIQGVIDHGKEFVVYRTYHNILVDSNLAIHCILLQLEARLMSNGKLPSTVYLQIDGGSENANKYTLAICELLIIRRLCRKIMLTRLPVGHTHENIDGKFALIWVAARNETILTPSQYLNLIVKACGKKGQMVRVEDIFVVPDYKKFFEGYIDDHLSNYAKNEDTQLQFIFESVLPTNDFPYGCKVSYRAFSSDVVYEILENPTANSVGFEPIRTTVGTFPDGGTWFLRGIPQRSVEPAPFIIGSRSQLEKFFGKFKSEFERSQAGAIQEWCEFLRQCPTSDDSSQFANMMKVPLRNLFCSAGGDVVDMSSAHAHESSSSSDTTLPLFAGNRIRCFQSTASVLHHNRGLSIPARVAPRIELGFNGQHVSTHSVASFDTVAINRMKVAELRVALNSKGLPIHGKKAELLARLMQALASEN